jgi:hypothetical protein
MSNLSWTRPLGVWNTGVIRAAELAEWQASGGDYLRSPLAPVFITDCQTRII